MSFTEEITIEITKKPGPIGIVVETTSFRIYSMGNLWKGQEKVVFQKNAVNLHITIVVRGQKGQEFDMNILLNSKKRNIKGTLVKNGLNRIPRKYKLSFFIAQA